MDSKLVTTFREITNDNNISEHKIFDYYCKGSKSIDTMILLYFEDIEKKNNLLQKPIERFDIDSPIDISKKSRNSNAFDMLNKGAIIQLKKEHIVKKAKDEYHNSFELYKNKESQSLFQSPINNELNKNNHISSDLSHSQNLSIIPQIERNFIENSKLKPELKNDVSFERKSKKIFKNNNNSKNKIFQSDKIQENDAYFNKSSKKLLNFDINEVIPKSLHKRSMKDIKEDYQNYESFLETKYLRLGKTDLTVTFEECYERLPEKTLINYRCEPWREIKGISKKLKNPAIQKGSGMLFLTLQREDLCRVKKFEANCFKLLNSKIIKAKLLLHKDCITWKDLREYKLNCTFYIRSNYFTYPLNKKNHNNSTEQTYFEEFERYRDELQWIFTECKMSAIEKSPFQTINSLNLQNYLIKKKFYSFLDNQKTDINNYQDLSPQTPMTLKLHDYQKKGLFWLASRENNTMMDSKMELEYLNPMWSEFETTFKFMSVQEDENSDKLIQYMKNQNIKNFEKSKSYFFYFNYFTGQLTLNFPYFDIGNMVQGGILADEMGLGKTIMMLSLIAFSKLNLEYEHYVRNCYLNKLMNKKKTSDLKTGKNHSDKTYGKTLIVMPTTLLNQWVDEINNIFPDNFFKIYVYKDENKQKMIDLSSYDIVLTTYGIARSDYYFPKYHHNLFKYQWLRVILDEANYIRNSDNSTAKAISFLDSCCRWAVTGTPLENSVNDLYSLFSFIDYEPWSDKSFWDKLIWNPLYKDKNLKILDILNRITKPIIIRRCKKMHSDELNLKKLTINDLVLEMGEDEQNIYQDILSKTTKNFGSLNENLIKKNFLHFYEIIMKLRQVCDHVCVYKFSATNANTTQLEKQIANFIQKREIERKPESFDNISMHSGLSGLQLKTIAEKRKEDPNIKAFVDTFHQEKQNSDENNEDSKICTICREFMEEVVLTFCKHPFCKSCIYSWLTRSQNCPICRCNLTKFDLFSLPKLIKKIQIEQTRLRKLQKFA